MSLRMRWFLVIGGLVALLVAAQSWWVHQLAGDLRAEADRVAVTVGRSMASFFIADELAHGEVFVRRHGNPQDALGEIGFEIHHVPDGGDGDPLDGAQPRHEAQVHVFDFSSSSTSCTNGEPSVTSERETVVRRNKVKTIIECDEGNCREKRFENGRFEERLLQPSEAAALGVDDETYRTWFQASARSQGDVDIDELTLHLEGDGETRFLMLEGPNVEHRVDIPQGRIGERLEDFLRNMLLGSMGILGIGLLLAGYLAHRVTRPLQQLAESAQRVGAGEWGNQVEVEGGGEIAQAITAFNHMSTRLAELDARNRELGARQHLGEIGEIARGLAHSLRNPLNALGLSVDELAAGRLGSTDSDRRDPDDATFALADSARRQIRRIDQSIRSFLALASQGGGVVTRVDLGQLADDVALEALQDARGRVRVDVERPDGEDLSIQGVEPELRAVLQALVVNAIEASPDGGRVAVRVERRADQLCLQVDDEGQGLPPEVRERLFTPHLSTKANGSGMGLFLAHRIAGNRYGGCLDLLDLDSGGTRAELLIGHRVEVGSVGEGASEGAGRE